MVYGINDDEITYMKPLLPSDEQQLSEKLAMSYEHGLNDEGSQSSKDPHLITSARSSSNTNVASSLHKYPDTREKALTNTDNFIQMYNRTPQRSPSHISERSELVYSDIEVETSGEVDYDDDDDDDDNDSDRSSDFAHELEEEDIDEELHTDEELNTEDYEAPNISAEHMDVYHSKSSHSRDDSIGSNISEIEEIKKIQDYKNKKERLEVNEHNMTVDPKLKERNEKWADRGAAKIVREVVDSKTGQTTKQVISKGIKDFEFGDVLGDGSYSTVMMAKSKETSKKYAVKVLSKEYLIRQKKVKYVNIEKNALQRLNNSRGVIKLFFTFQDEASLYFLLEYAPNGDFLSIMKKFGSLNEECACYYGAQMIDAIHFIHSKGIIHRDIKPENILLDSDFKVKLTDFGTAKILEPKKLTTSSKNEGYDLMTRSKSFVGTAEYVSPELLNDSFVDSRCDIWAFGCILFQMIAGKPPFKATNEYLTFQKVMKVQYAFTAGFPLIVRDLVKKILVKSLERRYTISNIKHHHFFKDKNFSDGSIWSATPPEIQPYKITAKSMQSLPKSKDVTSKKQPIVSKRASTRNVSGNTSTSNVSESGSQGSEASSQKSSKRQPDERTAFILENARKEISNRKSSAGRHASGAASAASIALSKKSNNLAARRSRVSSASSSTSHVSTNSASNAIDQQKLHAPAIPIHQPPHSSPTTIAGTSSKKHFEKATQHIMSLRLDKEWGEFLTSPDEHVLKVGEVCMTIIDTDMLEKRVTKANGQIVDPQSLGLQRTTLLTQVARSGGTLGLRTDLTTNTLEEEEFYFEEKIDEDDQSLDYKIPSEAQSMFVSEETLSSSNILQMNSPPSSPSVGNSNDESGFGKFRKFFHQNKSESINEPLFLECSYKRMFVITSHGHLLILTKRKELNDNGSAQYQLCYTLYLSQNMVKIKEIFLPSTLTSGNSGYSAIETPYKSFVFKYGKLDSIAWFSAIKKAMKANYDHHHLFKSRRGDDHRTEFKRKSLTHHHSYNLHHSHHAHQSHHRRHSNHSHIKEHSLDTESHTPSSSVHASPAKPSLSPSCSNSKSITTQPIVSPPGRSSRLFDTFVSSREKARKTAAPVPMSTKLTNGLPSSSDNPASGLGFNMLGHKSSPSSESNLIKGSNNTIKKTVNASNSRLLARSERSLRSK